MDNTIYDLGGGAQHGPRRSKELAGDMRDGWRATMQQTPCDPALIRAFIASLTRHDPGLDMSCIVAEISEEEARCAVWKCQREKTQGPDELGNDWCRDHAEKVTPLLTDLFNLWLRGIALPDSFGNATVYCIKKSRTSSTPLEHRPVALLNSDYKIFARIFAVRIRPLLPRLVNVMQAGFVPGHLISTVTDTLLAAQKRATTNSALRKAIALLLDFAKSHNSLDRTFLAETLRFLGFPEVSVRLVISLHANTRSHFQVNGFLSTHIKVACGIRQGCPSAPHLFILALELLYKKVEADPELNGVQVTDHSETGTVKVCGYADDTTIYVQTANDIPRVLAILDGFGAASGLKVNVHKKRVFLNANLQLARVKTMSVSQCAVIARAVAIPKALYIVRHEWPTLTVVTRLQQMIKRFVWDVREGKNARAWLSDEQAELPTKEGGIGMPNMKQELLTLAPITVARGAADADAFGRALGGCSAHASPPGPARRAFERLCSALLYNYPELLYRPHHEQLLRSTTPEIQQHHEWTLETDSTMLVHMDTHEEGQTQDHHYEFLFVQIWGGEARWKPNRKQYHKYVSTKRRESGLAARDRALFAQEVAESGVNRGLGQLKWQDVQRIPGLNTYATQTLFRLKANKIPLWNRNDNSTGCPHLQCSNIRRATSQHIFWDCSTAQAAWSSLLRRCKKVSIRATDDLQLWLFSLELPDTPSAASRTHPLVTHPTETSTAKEFFILFFDGGSRGNPGSRGSGAVIVRVQTDNHTAEILWVASMAYRHPSTTNNAAEYRGLVHGLRHAQAARLHPLHVVGDSAMVISQQRCHRPPKNTRLLQLYHKARRIADVIGVKSWAHHYREFNKMADRAANVAMDTQTSQQVAAAYHREVLITVTQFLDNNVLHRLSVRPGGYEQQWRFPTTEAEQAQQLQHHIHLVVRTASAAPSAL
ncbi:reverse transcriptase, partial [Globisporangium splendens]